MGEVVHSMLYKIVSLACVALTAGQVQIEGSPEWQAYKNAELAHIAPSIGPLAHVGVNFAQEQLNWQQQQLIHQQNALNFVASGAGRRKRQVQVAGSPEWQAYKNSELAFVAPSVGPTPVNYEQSALITLLAQPQDPLLSTMNSLLLTSLPQPQDPILSTMNSLLSTLLAQPQDQPLLTMNSLLLTLLPQPQDQAQ